ncbi:sporulation protein [Microbulbifer sp. OS29]|uniref:Sporulation protein n=1 Tax=Microbulbifer okhotskensis TaxID=2926617 RepID=A0A9X2ETD1_9GAMM|nr:sporulation protein [Microbulbifer okhotskensis]MCO1335408.1 sporulation protein [Microbulbifer okhotskensis]
MSMFQKLKASVGIGSAKVDTVLQNAEWLQGGLINGSIHVVGGKIDQQIDAISLKLCTEVKVETDEGVSYERFVLSELQVLDPFTIGADESRKMPFEFQLHEETPVTILNARNNRSYVWLETALDIDFALDPKDRDPLQIGPLPVVEKVLDLIERSGFKMVKADVERGHLQGEGFSSQSGCYQEIEFKNNGLLTSKEIELSFILEEGQVHCLAEIDRKFGMRGDQYHSFSLEHGASDEEIAAVVQSILD